ncbi:MAG TPA: hypothetical protein GX009_12830 [Candidatus Atribacteria bacterium]|nr:hypothetical protein [Candidatus Atribacteria bacterium]
MKKIFNLILKGILTLLICALVFSSTSMAIPEKTIHSYTFNGDIIGILGMKLFVVPERNVENFKRWSQGFALDYQVTQAGTINNGYDYVYLIYGNKGAAGTLILGTNINGSTITIHIGLRIGKAGVSRQDLSNTIVGALALYLLTSGFTNDFIQNNVLNNPSLINKLIDTSQKVEYKSDETVLWIWREKTKDNQQILMAQLRLFE